MLDGSLMCLALVLFKMFLNPPYDALLKSIVCVLYRATSVSTSCSCSSHQQAAFVTLFWVKTSAGKCALCLARARLALLFTTIPEQKFLVPH